MRLIRVLVVAAAVCAAALSMAQGFGGGGGQGRRGFVRMFGAAIPNSMLLNRQDVKDDLKITTDQQAKLDAFNDAQQGKMRDLFTTAGGDRDAMRKAMEKMNEEANKEIAAILTADQAKRLVGIRIQLFKETAVVDKDTATAVGLTADQQTKVRELQRQQMEANTAVMQKAMGGEIDRTQADDARKKNEEALKAGIGKLLTDAQKAKLKELSGPEFKEEKED